MSETTAKIRLKFGQLEIEYEGRESFLKNDLSHLLDEIVGFCKEHGTTQFIKPPPSPDGEVNQESKKHEINFSIGTIASRMNVTSGADLALAASVYLTLVKGNDAFSRDDIRTVMKEAKSYYKTSMVSNLSASLKSLVKSKRLNEIATDKYALTANEKDAAEKLLA